MCHLADTFPMRLSHVCIHFPHEWPQQESNQRPFTVASAMLYQLRLTEPPGWWVRDETDTVVLL